MVLKKLFVCRLQLEGDHYYPVNYDHNQRMLGAFIGLKQLEVNGVTTYRTNGSHTQIAGKSKLLNLTAWNSKT
ncbi:MAG: hypothetical protein L3J23_08670 [Flavobacteriaceae bacterium]|nr:hypothetical protein [Flavobacteriaceae bacterium]